LPYFTKTADELTSDLDLWPYVLNNGRALNLRALPGKLRVAEIEETLEAWAMLTQAFCELPSWLVFLKDSTASVEDACPAFPVLFGGDEVFRCQLLIDLW